MPFLLDFEGHAVAMQGSIGIATDVGISVRKSMQDEPVVAKIRR
jgi:hypothetical protein